MPEIRSYAPGIYARSEELAQATRDLDRTEGEAAARQDAGLRAFLDAQREAGFDYFSDGLLNWRDVFWPFEAAMEISRLVEPLAEPFFRIGDLPRGRWVATLPSPHALAERAAEKIAREKVLRLGAAARTLKDQNLEEGAVT